jgi:hypothetical protein
VTEEMDEREVMDGTFLVAASRSRFSSKR